MTTAADIDDNIKQKRIRVSLKTANDTALEGFWLNFIGVAFWLVQTIGGLLIGAHYRAFTVTVAMGRPIKTMCFLKT